jgi:hypothetical protein
MKTLSLPLKDSDIDTRGKRRRACRMISAEIWRIYLAEEAYMLRIPPNIAQGYRYLFARRATDDLLDAAVTVSEAFEPF